MVPLSIILARHEAPVKCLTASSISSTVILCPTTTPTSRVTAMGAFQSLGFATTLNSSWRRGWRRLFSSSHFCCAGERSLMTGSGVLRGRGRCTTHGQRMSTEPVQPAPRHHEALHGDLDRSVVVAEGHLLDGLLVVQEPVDHGVVSLALADLGDHQDASV